MHQFKTYILISLVITMLSACAHSPKKTKEFHLTAHQMATLPNVKIASIKPFHTKQLLTSTYNNQNIAFISLLDIKPEGLSLLALSPLGVKLFSLTYTSDEIIEKTFIPNIRTPKASDILSNIILAYYPTEIWSNHIPKNWSIKDSKNNRKVIDSDNNIILEIFYESVSTGRSPIKITNHSLNFTLNLKLI